MISETIDLYDYFALPRNGAARGFLHSYRHGQMSALKHRARPAMLVFPGGGYEFISERESEPVAMEYYHAGFDAFVLEYDVAPECVYPTAILEAGMAMMYLRREAPALGLKENRIAAIGFSAGGHLCGCTAFLWDDPALEKIFGASCEKIRPDACVLAYPVVTAEDGDTRRGSFRNFCGDRVPYAAYSLDDKVRPSAPPCFLWTTTDDDCVPAGNSVRLYAALLRARVPSELHIFEHGPHGLTLCTEDVSDDVLPDMAHIGRWVKLSEEFLRAHGFVPVRIE